MNAKEDFRFLHIFWIYLIFLNNYSIPGLCEPQSRCVGNETCDCNPGYAYNGTACIDIDECHRDGFTCGENSVCENTEGSFRCICDYGYVNNGTLCVGLRQGQFNFTLNSKIDNRSQIEDDVKLALRERFTSIRPRKLLIDVDVFSNQYGMHNVSANVLNEDRSMESRLRFCDDMSAIFELYLQNIDQTVKTSTVSYDCCFKETFEEADFKGDYTFQSTLVYDFVTLNCTFNPKEILRRRCSLDLSSGAFWNLPDLSKCDPKTQTTKDLIKLNQTKICGEDVTSNCVTVTETAKNLSSIVSNGSSISNSRDVEYISNVLGDIIKKASTIESSDVKNNIIETVSNVMESNASIITRAEVNYHAASKLLSNLNNFALKIGDSLTDSNDNVKVSTKNIGFEVSKVKFQQYQVQADFETERDSLLLLDDIMTSSEFQASGLIPQSTFTDEKIVYAYAYREPKLFVVDEAVAPRDQMGDVVQSLILTLSLGNTQKLQLAEPVIMKFKRKFGKNSSCSYWETSGRWSTDGCQLVSISPDDIVTCSCNHLTSFALLFNVYESDYNPFELQVVSWIGCGISIFGLIMTMIVHISIGTLRKTLHSRIIISLSFTLIVVLIVFLSAFEKTDSVSKVGCQVISGVIHYFMLASFMWMAVSALNLFQKIVFAVAARGRSDLKFFIAASFIAWGIPLIITIVTGVVAPNSAGSKRTCFLTGNALRYAVILPITLIIFVNLVSLIGIMVTLATRKSIAVAATDHWKNVRIAFMCSMLFGLTWCFAFLAFGQFGKVFHWLFSIFNSLQGFFIFVFYTLKDIRFQEYFKSFKWPHGLRRMGFRYMSYDVNEARKSEKYAAQHSEIPTGSCFELNSFPETS